MENIEIKNIGGDNYVVDTTGHRCKGYYKRLSNQTVVVNLEDWLDKKTKKHKTKKNKLYNHMQRWFVYMIEKYYI